MRAYFTIIFLFVFIFSSSQIKLDTNLYFEKKQLKSTQEAIYNGTSQMVTIPSPTAAGLIRAGNAQSNLYTGAVSVNIPLYTVTSGNLTAPIGLSYNSNGVKVDDRPRTVGMTWVLNAGGVITRVVNGSPDEMELESENENKRERINYGKVSYDCGFLNLSKCYVNVNLMTHMLYKKSELSLNDIDKFDDSWDETFSKKETKPVFDALRDFNHHYDYKSVAKGYNSIIDKLNYENIESKFKSHYVRDEKEARENMKEQWDYKLDKFYFSFNRFSGYFYINPKDNTPILFSNKNLKINIQDNLESFVITTDTGVKYYFGQTKNSKNYVQSSSNTNTITLSHIPKNDSTYDKRGFVNYINSTISKNKDLIKTSWFLTKIESHNSKDKIHFIYSELTNNNISQNNINILLNKKLNDSKLTYKKKSNDYFLNQNIVISNLNTKTYNSLLKSIKSKDISIHFHHMFKKDIGSQLSRIKIYDKNKNNVKSFSFDYEYQEKHKTENIFKDLQVGYKMYKGEFRQPQPTILNKYYYNSTTNNTSKKNRNYLKAIYEYSKEEHNFIKAFEFEYTSPFSLPVIGSYKQNLYGYYTNYPSLKSVFYNYDNDLNIGNDYYSILGLEVDNTLNPTKPPINTIKYGLLKSIKHQHGKIEEFHYDTKEWGCKVDKIKVYNTDKLIETKSFIYENMFKPYGVNGKYQRKFDDITISPKGFTEQNLTQGSVVGYGKVTLLSSLSDNKQIIYFNSTGYNNIKAKSITKKWEDKKHSKYCYYFYEYDHNDKPYQYFSKRVCDTAFFSLFERLDNNKIKNYKIEGKWEYSGGNIYSEAENNWGTPQNRDYLRGKISKTEVLDKNNNIISKTDYIYNTIDLETLPYKNYEPKFNSDRYISSRHSISGYLELSFTDITYELLRLYTKTTINYLDDKPVKILEEYAYNDIIPKYINSVITYKSTTKTSKIIDYSFEYNFKDKAVKDYLNSKHIKSIPIKTSTYRKENNLKERQISGEKLNYKILSNHAVIDSKQAWFPSKDGGEWKEIVKIDKYDNNFNILQYHGVDNIPISFLWEGNQPIVKAVNLKYNQLSKNIDRSKYPKASITTYDYEPLIGIKSQTNPNGQVVNYHYDGFGRLEYLTDEDNNLIKQHIYNYGNPVNIDNLGIGEMQVGISFKVR